LNQTAFTFPLNSRIQIGAASPLTLASAKSASVFCAMVERPSAPGLISQNGMDGGCRVSRPSLSSLFNVSLCMAYSLVVVNKK
jgi:hypothetical protein